MATFFGEVRDITSRAVGWSDDEEDDDAAGDEGAAEELARRIKAAAAQGTPLVRIEWTTTTAAASAESGRLRNFTRVLVSLGDHAIPLSKRTTAGGIDDKLSLVELGTVSPAGPIRRSTSSGSGQDDDDDDPHDRSIPARLRYLARLYMTSTDGDEAVLWIRVNSQHPLVRQDHFLLVRALNQLMDEVMKSPSGRAAAQTQPPLEVVVLNMVGSVPAAGHLTNEFVAKSKSRNAPRELVGSLRPLVAPNAVTQTVAASIFEYCTLTGVGATLLNVPRDPQSSGDGNLIVTPLLRQVLCDAQRSAFGTLMNSNIYI